MDGEAQILETDISQITRYIIEKDIKPLKKYNIVGEKEVDNLELAQFISEVVGGALHYEMVDFHSSRPGHDLRYALDGSLLKNLGFDYPKTFEDSLKKTIKWYLEKENMNWLGL